jgi:hypothetical protein
MSEMLAAHPGRDIALTDICLPASHDAAMYLTQHCTAFANTGNTQTQYLPMQQQLEAGLRLFDLRPWRAEGTFYCHHSTHCDGLGCKGDRLDHILTATREFVDTHRELVILCLTHYCHTSASDTALLSLLTRTLGDRIYRETETSPLPLIQIPLRQLLPTGGHQGRVLLILESAPNTPEYRASGLYSTEIWHTTGGWSDDNVYAQLREHQLQRLAAYPGNGTALYELAWQITQHNEQALRSALAPHARVSIKNGAYHANLQLPALLDSLISSGTIHRGKIPNILWSDFADTAVVRQCIKLTRVNLE